MEKQEQQQETSDGIQRGIGPYSFDFSGDFAMGFPLIFLQSDEIVRLSDDKAIREYTAENGIILDENGECVYVSLYRSRDIFVAVSENNTRLYNPDTGASNKAQYFVYDIYIRNIENFYTVSAETRKPFKTLMAQGAKGGTVVAAVNGDYMGNTNHVLVSVRNGAIYRAPEMTESDICVLYYNGVMKNYTPEEYDRAAILEGKPYQIWNFGPSLLDGEGKAITEYNTRAYDTGVVEQRNPRTAIGYYEPGHYFFLAVDGRSSDSGGATMDQLAAICEGLGAKIAYNMDGGDSAQAYSFDTVLRDDAQRHADGDPQRNLWDIIVIGERTENE